jgi:hypothetical protein
MLCESPVLGYINEPLNLATPPGAMRVPVDRWFYYFEDEW